MGVKDIVCEVPCTIVASSLWIMRLARLFSGQGIQPAYGGLAHEERWFELSHIVGILLSIYYYGFITDAAHAALVASILVFFYFDPAPKKIKRRAVNLTLKGRGGL